MGREARRVPMEFDWPLGEVWDGYLMPKRLHERPCDTCAGSGWSPEAQRLSDQWYGNAPFDPADTGSTPFDTSHPQVRVRAERNVERCPEYYGSNEAAVRKEARRLANLFNACWSHHLDQDDVDALLAEDRLTDLTTTWSRERGRQDIIPPPVITPAVVNEWSLAGWGHDSINQWICVQAKCARLGVPSECQACAGHGSTERWPGQRAEAEAWERNEPPKGDGWQLWETTSEGSPKTPVFATPEELAEHCETAGVSWFGSSTATKEQWLATFVGTEFVHIEISPGVIIL